MSNTSAKLPTVSICIPTYNRADTLKNLLDSISNQDGYIFSLEIVISDNASSDDTAALVKQYITDGLPITYHRFDENKGFDRNLLQAVTVASGVYCWLFGSDDILEPGALARIQNVLERYPNVDGLSLGSHGYNKDLSAPVFVNDHISTEFADETMLAGRDAIVSTVGPWMGFISVLVVRRDRWIAAMAAAPFDSYLRGYIQLYILARMLDERSQWLCVPDHLVGARTSNDSFLFRDEFARTRLDIEGYDEAFGDVLGRNHPAYHQVMKQVSAFYIRNHFLTAKLMGASRSYWKQAVPVSISHYWRYPSFWFSTLPIAIVPGGLFRGARSIYRRTLRPIRDRRRRSAA